MPTDFDLESISIKLGEMTVKTSNGEPLVYDMSSINIDDIPVDMDEARNKVYGDLMGVDFSDNGISATEATTLDVEMTQEGIEYLNKIFAEMDDELRELEEQSNNIMCDDIIEYILSHYNNIDSMVESLSQEERFIIITTSIELQHMMLERLYELGLEYDNVYWDSKLNSSYILDTNKMDINYIL